MPSIQEILLGVLMVAPFTSEILTNTQVCNAASQVKLSELAALRHNYRLKTATRVELEDKVKKQQKS